MSQNYTKCAKIYQKLCPKLYYHIEVTMKKIITSIAVSILCIMLTCCIGGYSQVSAQNRKIPIYNVDRSDNRVAISFDAAWGADKTRQIMDVCESYNVKATFFLVGFWIDKYPEMVKEIDARGFEIGTHSETHPQMSKLSRQKCTEELQSSCQKIYELTGKMPKLFRPPFGDYNNQLIEVATELGLYTIQWSVDSLDWKGISARQIAERVQKAKSGDIILCHNNSDHIVEALPLIFEALKLKNLQFCPIGDLIYTDNYHIDNTGKQILNLPTDNV